MLDFTSLHRIWDQNDRTERKDQRADGMSRVSPYLSAKQEMGMVE